MSVLSILLMHFADGFQQNIFSDAAARFLIRERRVQYFLRRVAGKIFRHNTKPRKVFVDLRTIRRGKYAEQFRYLRFS